MSMTVAPGQSGRGWQLPVADLLLAGALWVLSILEIALGRSPRLWPDAVIAGAMTVPVALRRRWPLVGAVCAAGGLAVLVASGEKTQQYVFTLVSLLVILYSVGAYGSRLHQVVGLITVLTAAVVSAALQKGHNASDVVFAAGVVAVPFTVGLVSHRREGATIALRERTEQLERRQAERERAAVAAERDRIARELHDIVAHAVSLMVLQANAGDRQLDSDPKAARQAFAIIRDSGKGALIELRRMLDLLHGAPQEEAVVPQPSLADLEQLVDRMRRAGLPVVLELEHCGEVPASVAVAAYRVAQEALTNANRHAHGAPVMVRLVRQDGMLNLRVTNGAGGVLDGVPGGGYGLAGMRERVKVFGGRFDAAPTPDGGFAVDATLPLEPGS